MQQPILQLKKTRAQATQWINRQDVIIKTGLKNSNKPDLVIKGKSNIQSQTFINANLVNFKFF